MSVSVAVNSYHSIKQKRVSATIEVYMQFTPLRVLAVWWKSVEHCMHPTERDQVFVALVARLGRLGTCRLFPAARSVG